MFANTLTLPNVITGAGTIIFTRIREMNDSSRYVATVNSDQLELIFSHQAAGSVQGSSQKLQRHLCQLRITRPAAGSSLPEALTMNFTFMHTSGLALPANLQTGIKLLWALFDGSAYTAQTPVASASGLLIGEL